MKFLFALTLVAVASGCVSVRDENGGTRFYQSQSPTNMGAAIFTKEIGFQDTAFIFEVRDPKVGEKPIHIGLIGDEKFQGLPPEAAVWSKDGSVIAVRASGAKAWTHAYDFRKSHDLEDVYPASKRAVIIEKLLKSRGGNGAKVLSDWKKFDAVAQPVATNDRSR